MGFWYIVLQKTSLKIFEKSYFLWDLRILLTQWLFSVSPSAQVISDEAISNISLSTQVLKSIEFVWSANIPLIWFYCQALNIKLHVNLTSELPTTLNVKRKTGFGVLLAHFGSGPRDLLFEWSLSRKVP